MKGVFFYDLWKREKSQNIETIFPSWSDGEVIVIFSPHDDDALLGAGYLLQVVREFGAQVYVVIACNGCGGYTTLDEKERIVEIRKEETIRAYAKVGVGMEHIIRLDFPDFSLRPNLGWKMPWGGFGTFEKTIRILRELKTTRLLLPNPYREHADHEATYLMGAWDGPQAGDPIMPDYGKLEFPIKSYLEYSVWGKFSPFHALCAGQDPAISANKAIVVSKELEDKVVEALSEYRSQAAIISDLVSQRLKKKVEENFFVELFLSFEARPKFDFKPYLELIRNIK
ncbi:PIG-L family deacetylase [Thermatribacter velox]|jgi:LmbE family N-acetylglucosaminyl deacetylase|uniref:PIG-L family deacetylase n=1 Tax=Thermatribacter velox TaxID=3039681 RepID=A0ABZ2Y8W1_9BACT